MPSVAFAIDSSGAERGAQRFSSAIDRVVADATRAVRAIEQLDRATRGIGQATGAAGTALARITQANQQVGRGAQQAAQHVGGLTLAMRNMSSAAALSFGPLSGLGARFTAIGSLATRNSVALGGAVAAATALSTAFVKSVQAAADYEAAMLRVAKVTNASNSELQRMSADTLRLSSSLGIPATELAKIEAGAAQLGIRGSQNLAAFAEQVAMLTRTSDLGAEQATQALARLMNITGEGAGNIAGMAAALTDLGNKSAASESQILSMALELGRGTAAFDVSSQQILALGAALSEVGEKSERSATAVSQVFIAITDAASGGDKLQDFADVLGITAQQFQDLAQKDIGAVFQRLLGVLAQQGAGAVSTLRELEIGSARNTKVLLSLAEVLDKYQRNLGLVAEQYRNPTAAADEFARMNDSVNRQVEIAGVQLTNIATTLGSAFLPAINDSLQGLNAFLLLMQGIEPKVGSVSDSMRTLATVVGFLGEVASAGTAGWKTFVANLALPPGVPLAIEALSKLYSLMESPPTQAELFPNAAENVQVLSSAVGVLNGEMNASRVDDFAAAFPPLASSIDGVADSAVAAGEAVSKMGRAVNTALAELQAEVDLKKIELEQGKAAASAQKIINELQKDGGKVTDEQRASILALAQANENLDNRLRGVSKSHKEAEKSAKDATKAYEAFADGLGDVVQQLESELELQGLDDGQKAVVELTQKIEELRQKAVDAGVDEAAAREAANQKLQEAIQVQQQLTQAKQDEVRGDTLAGLREQVELRRIEVQQGEAAAETQRIINDLKEQGIEVTDEYAAQIREQVDALGALEEKSSVVADAFEDFIAGIAAGTQDLSLDGISDAFKAAFAASVKEKLKFDDIFKGNLLDLVGFAGDLFSGGGIDIGGLFSFGGGSGGGGAGGGAGGWLNSILGGGGGGLSLGTLLTIAAPGIGAGASRGPYAALAGVGTNLLFEGAGNFLISNLGQDALALLGGETFAGTVGDWAGNSGWFSTIGTGTTWGGQLFGGGSVAGSFGGGAIGSAAGSLVSAGLNLGASYAGQATADAMGIRPLYGTEGSIHMAIGNTVAAIIGNYFAGPLGGMVLTYLNEILQPLLFGALGIAQPPTKGTMQRRMGESYLDSIPIFDQLQDQYGDVTRKFYRSEDAPWLADSRAALGEDAMRDISGFAGIFAQMFGGDVDGGGRVAGMVEEWTNILTDFFGRMDQEGEETGLAIRQHLAQAFREMGVDAADAMEIVNELGANLLFAGGAANVDYFGEEVSNVTNLGEALRGTAAIFESELPAGVHIAALALESMTRDGVKAFGDLDNEGRETLVNLAEDAENFDKVLAHLFEQGFTIDTEEFEKRLEAITQSATFLGENLGAIFNFDSAAAGVEAIFQQLKGDIFQTFQATSMEQLFGGTNIAAAFEPVYAALARIDEFDLTTATGAQDFMAILTPALAAGEANLKDYLPILQVMIDNWKEIQEIIDEAMKPDVFEQAALVAEEAFNGIGGALSTAIEAGIAVLSEGGTWEQAVSVFDNTFGAGVEKSFKDAIFNAIVQAAVIDPLVTSMQPAFEYVVAAGLIHGFGDERVQQAFDILLRDANRRAKQLGLIVFKAKVDSEEITSDIERAFNDAADITLDWASDFKGEMSGALDAAFDVLRDGGSRDAAIDAWSEALNSGTYDSVLDAIARALIDAALLEPFIQKHAPEIQFITAGALEKGWNDPKVKEAMRLVLGPGSDFRRELDAIGPGAIDIYATIVMPDGSRVGQGDDLPPGLDLDGSQSGTGGRTSPGRRFPGAATGGAFGIGETFIVGEAGPELVETGPGGINVTPISMAQADMLLDGGLPGYATGRRDFPTGNPRELPGNPPGGGRDQPRDPIDLRPGGRDDDFTNPTSRPRVPPPSGRDARAAAAALAIDVEIALGLNDAIEEFLRGGSLSDFEKALDDGTKAAVLDGLIKGLLESGPIKAAIDAFNKQMGDSVTKALRDGVIDAQEQADLDALAEKLGGNIETAVKNAKPAVDAVTKALGLGLEGEVNDSVMSSLETAFRDFVTSGDLDAAGEALQVAFREATLNGIIEALLAEGPIADAIESAGASFRDAFSEAMEDGVISSEEAARLRDLGAQLGTDLQTAFAGLDPAMQAIFAELRDGATSAMTQAAELIGSSLNGLLSDPTKLNFKSFSEALRGEIYQSVAGGLIDAFIESAVIQGALAPMLGAIQLIFDQIGQKQLTIAEANGLIAEQIGLMLGVLTDPAFKAAIDTLLDGVRDIGKTLGAFPPAASAVADAAAGVTDAVTQAEKDVCDGACGMKEETVSLGDTTLDPLGRGGYMEDIVFRSSGSAAAAAVAADVMEELRRTLAGGNGRYGTLDWEAYLDPFDKRFRRDRRRVARGLDSELPGFADGGVAMSATPGIFGEAGPEALIPLDQFFGSSGTRSDEDSLADATVMVADEIAEMRKELRDEVRSLRKENADLRAALEARPMMLEAKIGEAKAIEILWKLQRSAKDSGIDLTGGR